MEVEKNTRPEQTEPTESLCDFSKEMQIIEKDIRLKLTRPCTITTQCDKLMTRPLIRLIDTCIKTNSL